MRDSDNNEVKNWRPLVVGALIAILVIGVIVWGALRMMANSKVAPPPRAQKIIVMPQQAPPPPPPPPKEEPPPPPEQPKIEEPTPQEEPQEQDQEQNDEPPPGDDLGVDAEGSGSGDGFGLVGKKGGRGLIGGGDRNRWFAGQVQQDLQRQLADNEKARAAKYGVVVKLWFKSDGSVDRYEMAGTVGDKQSEAALRSVLDKLRLSETPPEDMPQPLKLRIVSR